jgi:hypothetical protein
LPDDAKLDLARIGLGVGDEVGERLGRERRIDRHHDGGTTNARDRRDVADDIETRIRVERRVDGIRRGNHEERVAVRRRSHDHFGGDIGVGPVLDSELLPEPIRQPSRHEARDEVGTAAGGIAYNDAHRPRRIGLRPSEARYGRQRGSAHRQMQQLSTVAKFHVVRCEIADFVMAVTAAA